MIYKNILLFLILLTIVSSTYAQTIWYVDQNASGTQSGTSWSDAFHELQFAINTASSGDSIWVASGTYYPTEIAGGGSNQRDMTFLLKDGISIIGGFTGSESEVSQRNTDAVVLFGANITVLSGDLGIKNNNSDNAFHVVTILGNSTNSAIDGFEIRQGNANDSSFQLINSTAVARNFGGGVYLQNSDITINYCRIRRNRAKSGGGGMYSNNNQYTLTNSGVDTNEVVSNNSQYSGGGGILNINTTGSVYLTDFTNNKITDAQGGGAMRNENSIISIDFADFKSNTVINGDGGSGIYNAMGSDIYCHEVVFSDNYTNKQGAGMYNDNSKPNIVSCTFIRNISDNGGGAMENDGGSDAMLNDVFFTQNEGGVDGGAIQNWKSSPSIKNCSFLSNTAGQDGGAIFNYTDCHPFIANSYFSSNTADRNGGAIYNRRNSNPTLTNLLIINNTAGAFGGSSWTGESNGSPCSPVATNITAYGNHADSSGGGGFDDGAGNSKLRNSIITGNTSPGVDEIDAPTTLSATALFNTIIGTDYYVDGVTPPTPVSGQLFTNTAIDDYSLRSGSAAIDSGDSTYFSSGRTPDLSSITLDYDGRDRIQGNEIDLGAIEFCTNVVETTIGMTVSPDSTVNVGTTVTFVATYSGGGARPNFIWNRNQTPIPGPDTNVYSFVAMPEFNGDSFSVTLMSSDGCASNPSLNSNTIQLDITTGIDENNDFLNYFRLAPNPNNGEFKLLRQGVYGDNVKVEILDLKGQMIYSKQFINRNDEIRVRLDDAINSGVYIIRIATDERTVSTRVLIKNEE